MNPYLHEIAQRLGGRSVIGVVVVALLAMGLGLSITYGSASSAGIDAVGFDYYSGGAVHVDLWALDEIGNGVAGVQVQISFTSISNGTYYPPPPLPPPIYSTTVTTNGSGAVAVAAPAPVGSYLVEVTAHYSARPQATFFGLLSGSFIVDPSPNGQLEMLGVAFNQMPVGNYVAEDQLLVFWAGANGTLPTGVSLYACATVSEEFTPPLNCTGLATTAVGPLEGYLTFFPYPALPTPSLVLGQASFLTLELVNASGAILLSGSLQSDFGPAPAGVTAPYSLSVATGVGVLSGYAVDLGFFVPIAGFVMVYWSTTRPRASGSVDMVLVRPVTRRGLFLARYASLVIALTASAVVEVLAFDLFATILLGETLPASFVPALIGGTLVAGLAFSGLILLASHVFRSTTPTLAIGIAILLVTSLFWTVILFLLLLSTGNSYPSVALGSQLVAPLQFVSVVAGSLSRTSLFGTSVTYASVGIGVVVVAVTGVAWVVVPAVLAMFRAMRRD